MSKVSTVYEIRFCKKSHPHYRTKKDASGDPELLIVDAIGQQAAQAVDTKYKGINIVKLLKGFMIDFAFKPVDLRSRADLSTFIHTQLN